MQVKKRDCGELGVPGDFFKAFVENLGNDQGGRAS
jgi:hypothetical protein